MLHTGTGGQGEQRFAYDVNGHLIKLTDVQNAADNRRFVIDSQGNILARADNVADELDGHLALTRAALDAAGATNAQLRHHLLADGHTIGIQAAAAGDAAAISVFNFNADSLGQVAVSTAQRRYMVQTGDTLQSIAQAVYGDSELWYLIADANGLDTDDPLTVGMSLLLPDAESTGNGSQTFKPWNASQTVGDTTPTLPIPPAADGGCGGAGQVLIIVVAIAATVLTAGAAAVASGAITSAGGLTGMAAAGTTALTGGAATLGGAAVVTTAASGTLAATIGSTAAMMGSAALGAAVGSAVSQGVAIAAGMQDKFSWRQVGMSALTAGIGSGVGAASRAWGLPALVANALPGGNLTAAGIQAAGSNVIAQQSLRLAGLQDQFSWRQVAAAAAGGAIGGYLGEGSGFDGKLLTNLAGGLGSGLVAGRGKVDGWSAFGNALGQAVVGNLGGAPAAGDSQGETQLARDLRQNWNAMAGRTQLASVSEGPLLPLTVGHASEGMPEEYYAGSFQDTVRMVASANGLDSDWEITPVAGGYRSPQDRNAMVRNGTYSRGEDFGRAIKESKNILDLVRNVWDVAAFSSAEPTPSAIKWSRQALNSSFERQLNLGQDALILGAAANPVFGMMASSYQVGYGGAQFVNGEYGWGTANILMGGLGLRLTGGAAFSELQGLVPNTPPTNVVYRALTAADAASIEAGGGIVAKARNGTWTAAEHVANAGPGAGGAAANSPWISTSRILEVAESYNSGHGVVAIDLDALSSLQVEVWRTAPRVNGVAGLPYHRSMWAQEVTVFQEIPSNAILGPVKPTVRPR